MLFQKGRAKKEEKQSSEKIFIQMQSWKSSRMEKKKALIKCSFSMSTALDQVQSTLLEQQLLNLLLNGLNLRLDLRALVLSHAEKEGGLKTQN